MPGLGDQHVSIASNKTSRLRKNHFDQAGVPALLLSKTDRGGRWDDVLEIHNPSFGLGDNLLSDDEDIVIGE